VDKVEDQVDRGLERLLVEEQEKVENEMRAGMAKARLAAGDRSVTMFEMWGDPYNRIHAIREVQAASGLSIMEAKAFVEAYKWDRARTIEAAVEYARGELPRHLDLKPAMSTKKWLESREVIEAEPDLETYRCKKVQLYLYLLGRSTRYANICKQGEARLERPSEDDEST
jgi:ribosomal protein L7/L12